MAYGFDKQPASRPIKYQVLQYNSATVFSTTFSNSVQHIRVFSQLQGWGTINQTTSDSVIASSAGGVGMIVSGISTGYPAAVTAVAGQSQYEYFTVTPGQFFTFSTTSTSTGAISVTEMG